MHPVLLNIEGADFSLARLDKTRGQLRELIKQRNNKRHPQDIMITQRDTDARSVNTGFSLILTNCNLIKNLEMEQNLSTRQCPHSAFRYA